jgi:osmoprotectant transport system permease protein
MNLDYLIENRQRVLDLSLDHLQLSITAIAIALLIAVPLGLLVARYGRAEVPVLGALGVLYTLPSLAFLAIMIPILGLGTQPAIVMLAAYAQVFLVRNIAAGLRGVDRDTLEAARGVGMTGWQVFRSVQLPLALPVIVAGIRIALTTTISLATITAWIGAGGLGTLLFDGITRNNSSMILAGTIAITALAILTDQFLRLIETLTPVARARRLGNR